MPQEACNGRRKSVALGLREQIDNIEHEIVLSIEGTELVCIAQGQRASLASDVDLEIRTYQASELSRGIVDRMEPANTNVFEGSTFHVLVCERLVLNLTKKCIIVKSAPRVFTVLLPTRFVEVRMNEDEDVVDDEEVDLFEDLARDHAQLRVKGVKPPKGRVPIALTDEGKPLEDGIGDVIGGEIRSAAHFLAKRIIERRGELCDTVRGMSKKANLILRPCAPGSEVRVHQNTLDNLRRARIVCTNATDSVAKNKGLIRGVSKQIGHAVGDELQESPFGQNLNKHRGLREARRVLIATLDSSDELFAAAAKLPQDILRAVFDAVLDIIGHVWGDRAAEGGKHSLGMLADFLSIKWAFEWAYPSSLAFCGIKAMTHTACDNPSNKVLEHMENKRSKNEKEKIMRSVILNDLKKEYGIK